MAMVKPGTVRNGVIRGYRAIGLTQVSNGKYMLNLACLKACVEGLELQEKSIIGSNPTADYVRRDGDEGCEIWIRKRRFVSYVLLDGDGLVVSLSRSGFGFHRSQPKSNRLIEAHRWKCITILYVTTLVQLKCGGDELASCKNGN
ncbi:hypothetical protein WN943_029423 [Citrus x changshan-huyou]